ncbi:hypothetical protein BH09ACT6_BH09ACT6_00350 [soil metagenome]
MFNKMGDKFPRDQLPFSTHYPFQRPTQLEIQLLFAEFDTVDDEPAAHTPNSTRAHVERAAVTSWPIRYRTSSCIARPVDVLSMPSMERIRPAIR